MKEIFTEILSASRTLQAPVSVAYLGPEASFTHAAAQSHFGRSTLFSPQPTIFDVFKQVERKKADWGVVPVENSLEGTVKQALAQCQAWLRKNLPQCSLNETESTAKAAQKVLEDSEGAAIGSNNAASLYGLNIISEGIEDRSSNVTRFLVIGRGKRKRTGSDKTSIFFATRHTPGALYDSLKPFAKKEINLVKIESWLTLWNFESTSSGM
ncbi:MAG: hypothetical protein B1H13_13165 [Desulfobacteraceae bacterium 4484_190.3]|nr:MAG: hypothetical protein B1H13_13165 [Desulfobacteraceae bacterium 4484_190.3]